MDFDSNNKDRVLFIVTSVIVIICATLYFNHLAHGAEPRRWMTTPEISAWYRDLMQPDAPMVSCCGEADAFEADDFEAEGDHYVAIITNGKGIIPEGLRISIPNAKIKWDAGNPTGHGILFVSTSASVDPETGQSFHSIYCYVPPSQV